MKGYDFLKGIRREFDPCFRYIVLARETPAGDDEAFSDVLELIDTGGTAIVDRSLYHDQTSGTAVLVLKIPPNDSRPIDQVLSKGRLPEDIVFYVYENQEPLGKASKTGPEKRENH